MCGYFPHEGIQQWSLHQQYHQLRGWVGFNLLYLLACAFHQYSQWMNDLVLVCLLNTVLAGRSAVLQEMMLVPPTPGVTI
jgi:hypothetical protein